MKKIFKKAVSLTIALSTVAALSVSAFADAVAKPSDSKDAVTVTGYETLGPGQYAVAVVPEGFIGADDADIYYVNQADEGTIGTIIANMLLKEALADGTYEVRIGTNATVDEGVDTLTTIKFTVSSTPQGVQITLDYGNVNGDTAVDNGDAALVLQKYAQLVKKFTDQQNREVPETVGDVNGDTVVDNGDAALILQKYAQLIKGFTDQDNNPLTTYTYTYVAPIE